jgi:hypothetical protein
MRTSRRSGGVARQVGPVEVSIYDGQQLLGSYRTSKVSRFDAFDAAGRPIGKFNTAKAAANAILEARRLSMRRAAA